MVQRVLVNDGVMASQTDLRRGSRHCLEGLEEKDLDGEHREPCLDAPHPRAALHAIRDLRKAVVGRVGD